MCWVWLQNINFSSSHQNSHLTITSRLGENCGYVWSSQPPPYCHPHCTEGTLLTSRTGHKSRVAESLITGNIAFGIAFRFLYLICSFFSRLQYNTELSIAVYSNHSCTDRYLQIRKSVIMARWGDLKFFCWVPRLCGLFWDLEFRPSNSVMTLAASQYTGFT